MIALRCIHQQEPRLTKRPANLGIHATKDWECHCGKYKRSAIAGVICDRSWRRSHAVKGAARAHGTHRARGAGCALWFSRRCRRRWATCWT